jgi:hypothetical protein
MANSSPSAASGRRAFLAVAMVLCSALCTPLPLFAGGGPDPPSGSSGARQEGVPGQGARLFMGQASFANGGPSCAACHSIATLPFPGGGSLGPDLTGAYPKYGPPGLQNVLATLFFPTMAPIFTNRPLTPPEQRDLEAFFQQAAAAQPRPLDWQFVLMAVGGLLVLLAAGWAWFHWSTPPPVHRRLLTRRDRRSAA